MLNNNILLQLQSAFSQAGLNCPAPIITDSEIHRFKMPCDKANPCWYVVHVINENLIYASFGFWKRDINVTWCNRENNSLSHQERNLFEQKQKYVHTKQLTNQNMAKMQVQNIWKNAKQNTENHQYLARKSVKSHGLRLYKNFLIIPILHPLNQVAPKGISPNISRSN